MKKIIIGLSLIIVCGAGTLGWWFSSFGHSKPPIKVGILHSLTGTLGASEKNLVDATLMAIDEINSKGGVLGSRLEPIVIDGKSSEQLFAQGARTLIEQDHVAVIFGCWTSASRKQVKKVVEEHHHLLMYPVQYEGLESSPNIIYTGSAPNQALLPAVTWAMSHLGKRFFLVGSDYIFPHAANEILTHHVLQQGGTIVGTEYVPLGSHAVEGIIKKISEAKPDVILNTINGDSNIAFFKQLRAAGITPERIPTLSFSLGEPEFVALGVETMMGDYAVWNYFQSIDREENRIFINNFKQRYGQDKVVSNNIESAYINVYLWAHAVRDAGTTDPAKVIPFIKQQVFNGPGSVVYIDDDNNHAWRMVFIGKIGYNGQISIIWDSKKPLQPEPYPLYQSRQKWEEFLTNLYAQWGNQWQQT